MRLETDLYQFLSKRSKILSNISKLWKKSVHKRRPPHHKWFRKTWRKKIHSNISRSTIKIMAFRKKSKHQLSKTKSKWNRQNRAQSLNRRSIPNPKTKRKRSKSKMFQMITTTILKPHSNQTVNIPTLTIHKRKVLHLNRITAVLELKQ
jgi:hypothetical protein